MKKNVFLLFLITSFLIGCTTEVDVHESASKDTTPPGAITNLSAKSDNKSITLFWNNPTDEDFSGTSITFTPKVNSITQPVIVEGIPSKTSTKTFSGLRNNVEYSFTLVALDKNENGSEPASIKATPADTTPPAEVRNLTATVNEDSIKLEWLNPSDEDFYGVEISLTPATANFSQPMFMKGNPSEKKELTVKNLETEEDYTFTVKSIDIYNNKSSGIQRKATTPGTLTLDVTLPNDSDNIIFTNDEAPIKVTVTSSNEITKAVWKKGSEGISVEPNLLLNDSDATNFSITTKTPEVILHVTENGIYDIAAQNEKGIIDYKQVEIKTIDKNPLPAVTNLSVNYDYDIEKNKYGRTRYIEWTNPVPENTYDAPIKDIIISCIYNDNETDTDNTTLTINDTSTQNYSFELSENKTLNDYVHFNIKIIDTAGNESEITCSAKTDCEAVFITDIENAPSIIKNAAGYARGEIKIIVTGDFKTTSDPDTLKSIASVISDSQSENLHLDLSKIKNLETLKSFKDCKSLKSIILPEGLKAIEEKAFSDCKNLSNIVIPEGVEEIGEGILTGCSNLSKITIPKSVTTISGSIGGSITEIYYTGTLEEWCSKKWNPYYISSAYDLHINNEKVENANIQKGITSICDNAFKNCKSLSSIVIPEGVKEIGESAFYWCYKLSKITIPKSVTTISGPIAVSIEEIYYTGTLEEWCSKKWNPLYISLAYDSAYDLHINNEKVENANIQKGITSICDNAFRNCKSLSSIVIPEGVTEIGAFAFEQCESLSSIDIPEDVINIGKSAFSNCINLSSVDISEGVSEIGEDAFYNCSSLTTIIIPKTVTKIGKSAFFDCTNLSSVDISEGVTEIGVAAFERCESLSSIVIPKTVTKIGGSAFVSCKSLSHITIPTDIEIGNTPFYECANISSITFLGNEKTSISDSFFNKVNLNPSQPTKITIPDTIKDIGFRFPYYIKEIYYQGTLEDWCTIKFAAYNRVNLLYDLYINNEKLENAKIQKGITSISANAFNGCKSLSSIVIPEGVIDIGESAFSNCINLSSVVISEGFSKIGESAFSNCTNLSSVDISEGVSEIGKDAFNNCSSLTTIIIPKTVTKIGKSAFFDCTNLSSIDISEGITEIGEEAFANCSSLKTVRIPKTIKKLEHSLFANCTSLTDIIIPTTVREIGISTFEYCTNLSSIDLLSTNVTKIGREAFANCSSLTSVKLSAGISELYDKVFYNCDKLETITIPVNVKLIYSTTFENCDELSYISFLDTYTSWYEYDPSKTGIESACYIGLMSTTYENVSRFTNNNNLYIFFNRNYYNPNSN